MAKAKTLGAQQVMFWELLQKFRRPKEFFLGAPGCWAPVRQQPCNFEISGVFPHIPRASKPLHVPCKLLLIKFELLSVKMFNYSLTFSSPTTSARAGDKTIIFLYPRQPNKNKNTWYN